MKSICVFLGANPGNDPKYAQAARKMGQELAGRGLTTVYGGSRTGLMGILAQSALDAGGKVIGVIPESLYKIEIAHTGLTELHVADSMHERKALMTELSDGFVAMPGGIGTMDEIFEIFTWRSSASTPSPADCSTSTATTTNCSHFLMVWSTKGS
jgi:uncharacterized protein (TIGR00730 family)